MSFMIQWITSTWRWMSLSVGVLALGALWIAASAMPAEATTSGRIPSPRAGFLAPSFELPALTGEQLSLVDQRGKVVIINFWASWCPPCRAEMPALQRTYEMYEERGLQVLAVNSTHQDSPIAAAEFVRERGLTFPVLLDTTGLVSKQYLTRALPTTFFVDQEGVVREVMIGGPMSDATLRTTVERLLAGES
jgi:peroxiredoxin